MREVAPYQKLACIYDQLMDHVDYTKWAKFVLDLFNRLEMEIHSIIDLSCGTGNLISHLGGSDKRIWGCDQSISMIAQARKKNTKSLFFCNDIINMAIRDNSADCTLLLYDSLNYIINEYDLEKTFDEIHRILKVGGLFVFDIVSEEHCKEHYADYHESEYWDDSGYTRHSYYVPEQAMQFNEFRIVLKGETYFEKHSQRVYSIEYLINTLGEHSFEIVNIFDEFSFEEADKDSGRLHFVCLAK